MKDNQGREIQVQGDVIITELPDDFAIELEAEFAKDFDLPAEESEGQVIYEGERSAHNHKVKGKAKVSKRESRGAAEKLKSGIRVGGAKLIKAGAKGSRITHPQHAPAILKPGKTYTAHRVREYGTGRVGD